MKNANPFWKFFCSVKLTFVLLLSLAFTSIIGTVIPQNESPDLYLRAYGAFGYQFLDALGIFDMYHSWWFKALLLLLTINIVICSIDRLQSSWKIIFNRHPNVNPKRFTKHPSARTWTKKQSVEDLLTAYEPILAKRYGHCRVNRNGGSAFVYGEKGRLSRLGVYIVHASVIFLLVGGLVGSFFGFEGYVNIPEGEATDLIRIRNTGQIHRLDFTIRCDDFSLTLYETGAPKEYRSALSIIEGGETVKQKDIIVNDPLHHRGINIFQSSYGEVPPSQMTRQQTVASEPSDTYTLVFTSRASQMQYTKTARVGVPMDIPEGLGTFVIQSFEEDATFRGMDVGASLKGVLTQQDAPPVEVLLPLQFANFDKMRGGDVIISLNDPSGQDTTPPPKNDKRYYTGLQVTRDPGVGIVYAGFVLMILGCFVTFYLSHQQVCIVIEPIQNSSRVTLAGTSNRGKLAMNNTLEKIFSAMTEKGV